MTLNKAVSRLKFDKRLIDLNQRNKIISQDEYKAYLNGLEDLASHSGHFEMEEELSGAESEGESLPNSSTDY